MKKSQLISILKYIPGDPQIRLAHDTDVDDYIGCIVKQGDDVYIMPSGWRKFISQFDISDDQEEIHYHDS